MKTKDELLSTAADIRDEQTLAANSALRVGRFLVDAIESLYDYISTLISGCLSSSDAQQLLATKAEKTEVSNAVAQRHPLRGNSNLRFTAGVLTAEGGLRARKIYHTANAHLREGETDTFDYDEGTGLAIPRDKEGTLATTADITAAIADKATKTELAEAVADKATKDEVSNKTAILATKASVKVITPLAVTLTQQASLDGSDSSFTPSAAFETLKAAIVGMQNPVVFCLSSLDQREGLHYSSQYTLRLQKASTRPDILTVVFPLGTLTWEHTPGDKEGAADTFSYS